MLTLKLGEAVESYQNLLKISNLKCSAKIAFRLAKCLKEFEPHIKNFESVHKSKLQEYGTLEDIDMQKYDIPAENQEKFESEMREMINEDVSLSFDKLNLDDFDGIEVEPSVIFGLMPLIKE